MVDHHRQYMITERILKKNLCCVNYRFTIARFLSVVVIMSANHSMKLRKIFDFCCANKKWVGNIYTFLVKFKRTISWYKIKKLFKNNIWKYPPCISSEHDID